MNEFVSSVGPTPENSGKRSNRTTPPRWVDRLGRVGGVLSALFIAACVQAEEGPSTLFSLPKPPNEGSITVAEPDAVDLGVTWRAWISDGNTGKSTAALRLIHSKEPYQLTNGVIIAHDWSDLTDQELITSINITGIGRRINKNKSDLHDESRSDWNVWTNTWTNGNLAFLEADLNCSNWTSNSPLQTGHGGDTADRGVEWTFSFNPRRQARSCNERARLYCFEQTPIDLRKSSRVFVTDDTYDGNLGGLDGADAKCKASAETAGLR